MAQAPSSSSPTPPTPKNDDNHHQRPFPNPIAAFLFDIDGTLVHSDPIHFRVFQELLLEQGATEHTQAGVPIDDAFFNRFIAGKVNAQITADLFPDWPLEQRAAWSARKEERFRALARQELPAMPGLQRLVAWLNERQHMKAAVTNAPRANAEAILAGVGLLEWFGEHVIIGDECQRPKPDPCPYVTACQKLGVAPEQCVVFEDSVSGAKAGVAAGAYVVGVLSAQTEETMRHVAGCHAVITDFDDPALWAWLQQQ